MPADPRRKIVNSRMLPEQIKKLDKIALRKTNENGRPVSRSQTIVELVEEEHERATPKRARRRRSA